MSRNSKPADAGGGVAKAGSQSTYLEKHYRGKYSENQPIPPLGTALTAFLQKHKRELQPFLAGAFRVDVSRRLDLLDALLMEAEQIEDIERERAKNRKDSGTANLCPELTTGGNIKKDRANDHVAEAIGMKRSTYEAGRGR